MRLGFVGTGAMSGAIAKGLRLAGDQDTPLVLFDVFRPAAETLASSVQGQTAGSISEVVNECDVILLGVKPQVQKEVLRDIVATPRVEPLPTLMSIAAGRSLAAIASDLTDFGADPLPPLIRVMPNVNAQIGASMSAITFTDDVPETVRDFATRLFNSVGQCLELPENLFDVFGALAGCSPAWFFQIVDSFARAGVKHGLTKQQALVTITQTMLGSAQLLQENADDGVGPASLIDRVCSPGGTTIAGLLAAQEAGLDTALVKAVDAAVIRDHELGN